MLTFELSADGNEIDVHLDEAGIALLRATLSAIEQERTHEHLFTPSWGGAELSETKQGAESTLMNKVSFHSWPAAVDQPKVPR